ncbi:MAG TPA: DUF1573 domain-containing protein [Planctomycetota bacterium]|nr:DUF1573 domain-containing protein [Planctomycetota bacterium]
MKKLCCAPAPHASLLVLLLTAGAGPAIFPQIVVTPEALDFGERGHNESPNERCLLTNRSDAPIRINELKASCGCMKVEPARPEVVVPPGGSYDFTVTMSSGRALGRLDKFIDVLGADPTRPLARIPARMRVLDGVSTEPRDLRFDAALGGPTVTRTLEIKKTSASGGPSAITLSDVRLAGPASQKTAPPFATRVIELAGGAKRIEITLQPGLPEGRFQANFEAKVDGKRLVVPVSGEIFRGILVTPTYFNFSRVDHDDPKTMLEELELKSTDGKAFRVISMSPSFTQKPSGDVRLELEDSAASAAGGSKDHVLRARIRGGEPPSLGSFSGKVIVRTDHPEKPELTLQFFGFFAERKK